MTNSIASSKCPSVLSSGHYGMSQNLCTDDSKEYIFVKLTDSAFRAIEEYQRNEHAKRFSQGQCAKIQFIGNNGVIHFPVPGGNGDNNTPDAGRKFGFAIDDMEGSLECIQQPVSQHQCLDVLGTLSHRMRIHANEDVYDTTRTKMAMAEETEKSKCIREIKPNQTDIGRKVKKQVSAASVAAAAAAYGSGNNNNSSSSYSNSNNHRSNKLVSPPLNAGSGGSGGNSSTSSKLMGSSAAVAALANSSRSPNPSLMGGMGTTTTNNNSSNGRYSSSSMSSSNMYGSNNNNNNSSSSSLLNSASSLSSTLASGISNGYASASHCATEQQHSSNPPPGRSKPANRGGNFGGSGPRANTLGSKSSMGGSSGGGSTGGNSKLPDISRRKIRERLIHLLALKPFKKPELFSRLQNEGLRDRERPLITNILKDISTMSRDNTYNLRRAMWNDVNENWPYYSEQELQQLKRRKPQNLTPPLSSDAGSSTSGQSPTSTHTGSPPPLVGGNSNLKRVSNECSDRYDDTQLAGGQAKKQRISHFKKETPQGAHNSMGPAGNVGGGRPTNMANSGRANNFSPLGSGAPSGFGSQLAVAEENSGNSDLSYNLLANADTFVSHVEQNTYYGGSRRPNSGSKSGQSGGQKEKRGNAGKERVEKKSVASPNAAAAGNAYAGFVPAAAAASHQSVSGGNRNRSANNYQRQSPQQQQLTAPNRSSSSSNSVIYSAPTAAEQHSTESNNSREDVYHQRSSSNHSQRQQSFSSSMVPSSSSNSLNSSSSKTARMSTPPQQPQHHHNHQQQHYSRQHSSSSSSSAFQDHNSQPEAPQQQQLPTSSRNANHQQQQHSSPTQQIAAAASAYASASSSSAADAQNYDFSKYTPITSIEQRRQYKTEFESDYDEYRKLLTQIEEVGKRFRGLAERLENARQGCPDYNNIKQQIVSEYERIRNEESLRRDKQRFDYLHEKLAHIKQLVHDYDKKLTSGAAAAQAAAAAAAAAQQQQQQLLQKQQYERMNHQGNENAASAPNVLATAGRHNRLSPMVASGAESNHSPPMSAASAAVMTTTSRNTNHHHQQQQQQQQQQTYQHHDVETIQQQSSQHHLTTSQHHLAASQHTQLPPSSNNNSNQAHINDSDSSDSSDSDTNDEDEADSDSNSDDDDDNVRY